jgi:hypothetical protein
LSRSSVSTFATELFDPNRLIYDSEHGVDFSLGFGPPIRLNVCTITPRDTEALRSYQRYDSKDTLHVQDSLPISLNLFSVESHAAELDAWLDGIIDSKSGLLEYVDLMLLLQKEHFSAQILRTLVSWYITSKNKVRPSSRRLKISRFCVLYMSRVIDINYYIQLSESARQLFRAALKLLITTTLLSRVPRVTFLPESLLDYFSAQSSHTATKLPTDAPKLLTRQIKASVYHLQQGLLCALFSHFSCAMKLAAEVKVAVALLVAHVLELVRNASRGFAKFAGTINSKVVVKDRDVTEFETNMQIQVFEGVRVSILDATGRIGGLGQMLRDPGTFSI